VEPRIPVVVIGAELLEHYLQPLAALPVLSSRIRLNTRVVAVARHDLGKARSSGRERLPFLVRVRDGQGQLHDLQARAVVDASGTWTQPNPLGASGLPALGEIDAGSQIVYGLPDIAGRDRDRYADRRVVVVGAGHSARPACSPWPRSSSRRQRPRSTGRSARPLPGRWSAGAAPRPTSSPPAGGWPPAWPTRSTPAASS
jgi:hypothetical protein